MDQPAIPTGLTWVKPSFTKDAAANCVEVAQDGDLTYVRNSRRPDGGTLTFDGGEWDAFVKGVDAGEFRR